MLDMKLEVGGWGEGCAGIMKNRHCISIYNKHLKSLTGNKAADEAQAGSPVQGSALNKEGKYHPSSLSIGT